MQVSATNTGPEVSCEESGPSVLYVPPTACNDQDQPTDETPSDPDSPLLSTTLPFSSTSSSRSTGSLTQSRDPLTREDALSGHQPATSSDILETAVLLSGIVQPAFQGGFWSTHVSEEEVPVNEEECDIRVYFREDELCLSNVGNDNEASTDGDKEPNNVINDSLAQCDDDEIASDSNASVSYGNEDSDVDIGSDTDISDSVVRGDGDIVPNNDIDDSLAQGDGDAIGSDSNDTVSDGSENSDSEIDSDDSNEILAQGDGEAIGSDSIDSLSDEDDGSPSDIVTSSSRDYDDDDCVTDNDVNISHCVGPSADSDSYSIDSDTGTSDSDGVSTDSDEDSTDSEGESDNDNSTDDDVYTTERYESAMDSTDESYDSDDEIDNDTPSSSVPRRPLHKASDVFRSSSVFPVTHVTAGIDERDRGRKRKRRDHTSGFNTKRSKTYDPLPGTSSGITNARKRRRTPSPFDSRRLERLAKRQKLTGGKQYTFYSCPSTCPCKTRGRIGDIPRIERTFNVTQPLHTKFMKSRLMDSTNLSHHQCCNKHCSFRWFRKRISKDEVFDKYWPSDLNVYTFTWGQWKDGEGHVY